MIKIVLAGFFTIGIIIFIHELGHFLAARAVGIHVHRFSLGFGPVLLRWRAFSTEWALSLLPFGGYVKMAGMEAAPMEGEVPEGEDVLPPEVLYRNKRVYQRFIAIIAGPLANLILAILLSVGIIYKEGEPIYPGTWMNEPASESPAATAGLARGDRIIALDGETMNSWNQVSEALESKADGAITLGIERDGSRFERELSLADRGRSLGRTGLIPLMDNRVGKVLEDGPADRLGLRRGDRILELDGKPVRFFDGIAEVINAKPDESVRVVWERDGARLVGEVVPKAAEAPDPEAQGALVTVGRIFFEPYLDWRPIGLGEAIGDGFKQVGFTIRMTLDWMGQMLTGRGSRDSVGGPILIFKTAGEMARWGFGRLLYFVAFFSTQLFLLNLMPIPVLDGGHLIFLGLEGLGLPVKESWRIRLTMVGLIFLLSLMFLVVLGDLGRVLF